MPSPTITVSRWTLWRNAQVCVCVTTLHTAHLCIKELAHPSASCPVNRAISLSYSLVCAIAHMHMQALVSAWSTVTSKLESASEYEKARTRE